MESVEFKTCYRTNSDHIHILSCYAPTFSASRTDKNRFLDDLQQALDVIPPNECYVVMGDFNARVGSRASVDDPWAKVHGPYGLGEINDAGHELLSFEATVCNTWFPKRAIYKSTWQHTKSKRWHCIDFAITRQRDLRRCLDVCVKRNAECNTDHQLLRIKLSAKGKGVYSQARRKSSVCRRRFAVSRFMSRCGENSSGDKVRDAYTERVSTKAMEMWEDNGTVEEKWASIRSALVEAAEEVLGHEKRQHPDWFQESSEILEPLLQRKNLLYTKRLCSGRAADHQKYLNILRDARRAVRNAKDTWFKKKADEAQEARFGGKRIWRSIRDIQRACHRELATSEMKKGTLAPQVMQNNDDGGNTSLTL